MRHAPTTSSAKGTKNGCTADGMMVTAGMSSARATRPMTAAGTSGHRGCGRLSGRASERCCALFLIRGNAEPVVLDDERAVAVEWLLELTLDPRDRLAALEMQGRQALQ